MLCLSGMRNFDPSGALLLLTSSLFYLDVLFSLAPTENKLAKPKISVDYLLILRLIEIDYDSKPTD